LVDVDVQVVADSEAVEAVGVEFGFGLAGYFGSVDGEDHVRALDLDAEDVRLAAVGGLLTMDGCAVQSTTVVGRAPSQLAM
jgi:hypothetical protein